MRSYIKTFFYEVNSCYEVMNTEFQQTRLGLD